MVVSRTALAPNRCCMVESEDIAMAMGLSHESGNGYVRNVAQNASVRADCRLISLVSGSSGCLQDVEVDDSASANVSERGRDHNDHGSWLKLAEHMKKPYSSLLWPYSIER